MAVMCVFGCPRATALELPLGNTVSSLFPYAPSKPNHLEELGLRYLPRRSRGPAPFGSSSTCMIRSV